MVTQVKDPKTRLAWVRLTAHSYRVTHHGHWYLSKGSHGWFALKEDEPHKGVDISARTQARVLADLERWKPVELTRENNPLKRRNQKRTRSTAARVKAAARKITQQIRALKLKRRKLHRGR